MKRIILVLLCLMMYTISSDAQVGVNVHIYNGTERLYFSRPHAWYISHGYVYSPRGYYIRHGKKWNPYKRVHMHRKGNNGNHYGHRKGHGKYKKGKKGR